MPGFDLRDEFGFGHDDDFTGRDNHRPDVFDEAVRLPQPFVLDMLRNSLSARNSSWANFCASSAISFAVGGFRACTSRKSAFCLDIGKPRW